MRVTSWVSFFVGLVCGQVSVAEGCDKTALELMKEKFDKCMVRYSEEYHDTRQNLEGELVKNRELYVKEATCIFLNKTIEKCGELWEDCHTEEVVRRMRELQTESIVEKYREDVDTERCPIVKKFYQPSARADGKNCSDAETHSHQKEYQDCSRSISANVFNVIQETDDVEMITSSLCESLDEINSTCIRHLIHCSSQADFDRQVEDRLAEMKEFLTKLAEDKIPKDALDKCKVEESHVKGKKNTQHNVIYEGGTTTKLENDKYDTNDRLVTAYVDTNNANQEEDGSVGPRTDIDENERFTVSDISSSTKSSASLSGASSLAIVMSLIFVAVTLGLIVHATATWSEL